MNTRVGIDVGGTFTDGIAIRDGQVFTTKVPSRPDNPAAAILACIDALQVDVNDISLFIHGSTIATNAIIEKKAAATAHIATSGFRDVLFIRRGDSAPYQLDWQAPLPVVRRRDVFEVDERINAFGEVTKPIEPDAVRKVAQIIHERGYPAVSVTLLNSYANPTHERIIKEILHEVCTNAEICISCEVLPHYREFERSSTTAANAYLMPPISSYLNVLSTELRARGYDRDFLIMQSNGGLATPDEASRLPGKLVRSGPAGGAIAAGQLANACELDSAVLIDIGGTSTEVALLRNGRPSWTPELEFTWGVPIRFPAVDIESIGAGGGSIGWVESGRFLKVGPHSAGADPGPACYDKGGLQATTTDAQVILGRLNPTALLGGQMQIRADLARQALVEVLGIQLDADAVEVASGMIKVSTNNIVQTIRRMTVNRGLDPRESALIAYGGNGPLYAVDIAELLGMSKVVVPVFPGVTSALGMVLADHEYDQSKTLLIPEKDLHYEDIEHCFAQFENELSERLFRAGVPVELHVMQRYLDVRYDGQGYELPVALPRREYENVTIEVAADTFSHDVLEQVKDRFHDDHRREFGWADKEWPIELVFARVVARGLITPKPDLTAMMPLWRTSDDAPQYRDCSFPIQNMRCKTMVWQRDMLSPGCSIKGPAIIEQMDATTLIPPGWDAAVDQLGNLLITCFESSSTTDLEAAI